MPMVHLDNFYVGIWQRARGVLHQLREQSNANAGIAGIHQRDLLAGGF
jgi:hypothetical protein